MQGAGEQAHGSLPPLPGEGPSLQTAENQQLSSRASTLGAGRTPASGAHGPPPNFPHRGLAQLEHAYQETHSWVLREPQELPLERRSPTAHGAHHLELEATEREEEEGGCRAAGL